MIEIFFKIYLVISVLNLLCLALIALMTKLGYDFSFLQNEQNNEDINLNDKQNFVVMLGNLVPILHIALFANYCAAITVAIVRKNK